MGPITAQTIIQGALRFINKYSPGESLDASDADDALETLNDLLESISTEESAIFASDEETFTYVSGQYQYTIGNYDAGTFGGLIVGANPVISGVIVPADMKIGGDLTAPGIPAGATVLSFNAGAGTVTMSVPAASSSGLQQVAYTIPGDFKTDRPLRITNAFTRIYTAGSGLDYPITMVDQAQYVNIGYKAVSAPWPIVAWYNPTMPLGRISFYQNPSGAAELHLYTSNLLRALATLTTAVYLPEGYARYLKRKLGRELAPEYGAVWTPQREKLCQEAENVVKALNKNPAVVSNYDSALVRSPHTDAGWILSGGFNR